jgi:hypothetical protein
MKPIYASGVVFVLLAVLGVTPGYGQATELQKLTAPTPRPAEYFGARVSVDGSVALVGSPSANFNVATVTGGEAHLFRYDGSSWVPEQILRAADPTRAVSYGMSVAVSGPVAVVAGYENQACTDKPLCIRGAAFVYRYNYVTRLWVEEQKLVPANTSTVSLNDWQNQLGPYVAVSGNAIVLGLHFDEPAGPNSGSAITYHYDGQSWIQQQKLTAQTPAAGAYFGLEVAIDGDVAVVGAYLDTVDFWMRPRVQAAGSAHVFRYDGRQWNREQMLAAYYDGQVNDLFGVSVSVSGDVIAVGSHLADDKGTDAGSAYVFRYNKFINWWIQEQKITASDATPGAELGRSVSVHGGVALISAFRDNTAGFRSGVVYAFRNVGTQWIQTDKMRASDEATGDRFGRSISLSGDIALICAYRKDDACPANLDCDSGAAYIFTIGKR